jgi:TonB-dependent starch-binding outer membrane protein SusC
MKIDPRRSRVTFFALTLLFFIFQSLHVSAQQVTSLVKGLVQSTTAEPLSGVSVIIRNTKNNFTSGTTTDSAGVFTFSRIPPGGPYSFTFSVVGYEPQTLSGYNIKDDITLSLVVNMKSAVATMNEVVVVGYNTQKRGDVTGAVGTVDTKELKSLPVPSVGDAIQGKAAGVQIISSGVPGNNPEIRIRGISTINNNSPLLVIDGVPTQSGLNQINMDDVESIQILKDASAAAIYGARGANGVVIITTKRGKGAASQLNFSAYYGIQSVARKLDCPQAGYAECFRICSFTQRYYGRWWPC